MRGYVAFYCLPANDLYRLLIKKFGNSFQWYSHINWDTYGADILTRSLKKKDEKVVQMEGEFISQKNLQHVDIIKLL